MPQAGDVVTVDFRGATGAKRRPAVVLSSDEYHLNRPDLILGVLTSNVASAITPSDYVLLDWAAAGLRAESAFRTYLGMATARDVRHVGRLSSRDLTEVRARVLRSLL